MNKRKRILNILVLLAAVVVLAIGFSACSDNAPMQSSEITEMESTSQFTMLKALHPRLNKAFEQSQWISTRGGTITVGDSLHGFSKLVIPYGAVGTSTDVATTSETDASLSSGWLSSSYNAYVNINFWWESNAFQAEFSPHGLQFNVPVRMELSYKDADLTGINEDDLRIYYFNEATGIWEVIGKQVDKTNKVVIGYTNHFSRYGVGVE